VIEAEFPNMSREIFISGNTEKMVWDSNEEGYAAYPMPSVVLLSVCWPVKGFRKLL